MKRMGCTMCLVLILLASLPSAYPDCTAKTSCSSCMSDPGCVWCKAVGATDRCRGREEDDLACPENDVVDNPGKYTITVNNPLSPDSANHQFVQISPQAVSLSLRPGKPQKIKFEVAHAKQFPVDLYFLMDLSWSMRQSRDNLASLGGKIIAAIKKKTENLTTGFGSFVEKNLPPFTSAIPEFNCASTNKNCTPPYSFHHKSSLADITDEEFKKSVLESPLAGNVDDPEGSLDALMQVMVCGERIGWRNTARKIIILATDRDFHFALDGKLAGILTPNDGTCHLNDTGNGSGYYTHGELLDYPSISHISSVAQSSNYIIIFAVIKKYKEIYEALTQRISGSYVDILTKDGENIINIVENKYEEITTSIKVSSSTTGKEVGVKFFTDCNVGPESLSNQCNNIPLGTPVQFTAEVNISKCLDTPQTITIFPVGLNENLTITIESACECACSMPGSADYVEDAAECSHAGALVCGQCQCDQDHYGAVCECGGDDDQLPEDECVGGDGGVCSGRGECVCGQCHCYEDTRGSVYGKTCQCDDWTCPQVAGVKCGGHGDCDCGVCRCHPGWQGDSCNCQEDEEVCVSPYDGEVCSGNGECRCGKCVCRVVEGSSSLYVGEFCEINPAGQGLCAELSGCVECQVFNSGPDKDRCEFCNFETVSMESSEVELYDFDPGSPCTVKNAKGCRYTFSVRMNQTGLVWVVLHTEDGVTQQCPPIGLFAGLGIGAGALVLLIGLLSILFYKCYIVIDDRRQYASFQKEADRMKSGVNQNASELYKSPITRFENPMFGKS